MERAIVSKDSLRNMTPAQFAALQRRPRIPRLQDRSGALPLSFAQQRLWFLDQLAPGNPFYNVAATVRLKGKLDVEALRATLNEIVRRHEVLRTRFVAVDGTPAQLIAAELSLSLEVVDLSGLAEGEREDRAVELAREAASRPFDLASGPLLRASLLRLSEGDYVLLFAVHHIVSDGWSLGVLINEIAALYGAYVEGRRSPLPELPIQYADYAHWQRQWLAGGVLAKQSAYWRQALAEAPELLALPTDRPRSLTQSHRGASYGFAISAGVTKGLRELGRQSGATLFMTLAAGLSVLLSRYSGQKDISIGTPIANRTRSELEPLIGFFVNTLVLRTRLEGDPRFVEVLDQVRRTSLDAYAHQDVPFEHLVEVLKPARHLSHAPLFQVMLALQNAPMGALELPGLVLEPAAGDIGGARFDLTLGLTEVGEELQGTLEYATDLFDGATIERLAGHFVRLLESIVATPEARVGALELLGEVERHRLLREWNDTAAPYPQEKSVHELFAEQAERTPNAIAVVYEDEALSYRVLNERSNRLAHHLRSLGIGSDVLVGIAVDRSIEMIVGILGILKAGGAYLPLDPNYPAERLARMLADAGPALVLTQARLLDQLPEQAKDAFCLDRDWPTLDGYPAGNPAKLGNPLNLAYVIYTSGSTGRPKGVAITGASLLNHVMAHRQLCELTSNDRVLQFATLNFDTSVEEIFPALVAGAAIVVRPGDFLDASEIFSAFIGTHAISVIDLPTAFWHLWCDFHKSSAAPLPECVRLVIVGGEKVSIAQLADWCRLPGRAGIRWLNTYGPTEATISVTYFDLPAGQACPQFDVPIGRPIWNTEIYVLDEQREPVPIGVAGELCIAGAGLARGYLNGPDLTAERFVPNPFGAFGSRIYRTGDLVRYLPDGNIEYLVRLDHQVKMRGFRIELGEVEKALMGIPGVRDAVVVASEDQSAEKRLLAYVVARRATELEVSELRDALMQSLPDYMVPSHFVVLDELPLTPSGKVDRKALPTPDMARGDVGYVAPESKTEVAVAAIWSEVLGLDRAGTHDNFFELGGHSLLATRIMSKVRTAFAIELPLRALFEAPTIATLAERVDAAVRAKSSLAAPPIERVTDDSNVVGFRDVREMEEGKV